MRPSKQLSLCLALAAGLAGCESTRLPSGADTGPRPALVEPVKAVVPTFHIAPAARGQRTLAVDRL